MPKLTPKDAKNRITKPKQRVKLAKGKRKFGGLKGLIKIGPEFFEPLPEEELKLWEGGS